MVSNDNCVRPLLLGNCNGYCRKLVSVPLDKILRYPLLIAVRTETYPDVVVRVFRSVNDSGNILQVNGLTPVNGNNDVLQVIDAPYEIPNLHRVLVPSPYNLPRRELKVGTPYSLNDLKEGNVKALQPVGVYQNLKRSRLTPYNPRL